MAVVERPANAAGKGVALLEAELATFEKHREELLGQAEGKHVLIKGTDIVGVFESKMDAIAMGYRRFGNVPFLVKQVIRVETPDTFTSNLIAL